MITTENLITKVKFGNNEKANIAVDARKSILTLQQLANEKQIGDKLEPTDIHELPKVEIEFFNTKSIDVLIGALEVLKRNLTPPPYSQLALAC